MRAKTPAELTLESFGRGASPQRRRRVPTSHEATSDTMSRPFTDAESEALKRFFPMGRAVASREGGEATAPGAARRSAPTDPPAA
jgi:hypothetical protein